MFIEPQKLLLGLILCACASDGVIFSRCRVKKRIPCGSRVMTYYKCRKMGCCYRWSLLGPTCFRAADYKTNYIKPLKPTKSTTLVSNPTPLVSNPTPLVSNPFPTTQSGIGHTGVWRSTPVVPSSLTCQYTGPRRECGFPGIDSSTCRARGCCWDRSMSLDVKWCFHPTNNRGSVSGASRGGIPIPTLTKPGHIYPNSKHINRVPSTTQPSSTIKTNPWIHPLKPNPNFSYGNTNQQFSAEERSFLDQIHQEILEQENNQSTTLSPSYRGRESNHPPLIDRSYWRDVGATTTMTTTTPMMHSGSLLRLLLQRPISGRNPQGISPESALTRSPIASPQQSMKTPSASLHQVFAFLKLINDMTLRKGQIPSVSNVERCEREAADSCCRGTPNAPCCGYREGPRSSSRSAPLPRVVGGTPAGRLRFSVAHLSKRPGRQHFCGGTLIARKWVLTAAHCVLSYCSRFKTNLIVSLGKYHKSPYPREMGQQDFDVIRVVCHPSQCKALNRPRLSDVALLQLSRAAIYTASVQPALLPNPYETPLLNRKCMALGWGSTRGSGFDNVLKEVSVPTFSNEQCSHPDWRGCLVKSCMMCAGGVNTDPCNGDSGGPLFCQRSNGLYILHGIYSWGRCGSSEKKPSIYSRASYFIEWIYGVVQS